MLKDTIMQAAGALSLCWTPAPTGTFDDQRALEIALQLIHDIKDDLRDIQTITTFSITASSVTLQASCDQVNTQANAYMDDYRTRYGFLATHSVYPSLAGLTDRVLYTVTIVTQEKRV